jgi:hypothetical protein
MLNIKDIVTQSQFNDTCEKIDEVIDETKKDIVYLKTKQLEDSDHLMRLDEEIDTKINKLSKEVDSKNSNLQEKINIQETHFNERILSLETFTNDKLTSYINMANTKTNNLEKITSENTEKLKSGVYKEIENIKNNIVETNNNLTKTNDTINENNKLFNNRFEEIENDIKFNYATKDYVIEQIKNIELPKTREMIQDRTMIEEKYLSRIMSDVKNTPETPGIFCEYNSVSKNEENLTLTLRTATILTKKVAGIMINEKEFVDFGYVWVALNNKDIKCYDCLMPADNGKGKRANNKNRNIIINYGIPFVKVIYVDYERMVALCYVK